MLEKHAGPALDEKSRHHVRVIAEAAQRMGRLIDDLQPGTHGGPPEIRASSPRFLQLLRQASSLSFSRKCDILEASDGAGQGIGRGL